MIKKKEGKMESLEYISSPNLTKEKGCLHKMESPQVGVVDAKLVEEIEAKVSQSRLVDKKGKIKKALQMIGLAILLIASLVIMVQLGKTIDSGGLSSLGNVFSKMNPLYFWVAILLFLALIFLDTLRYSYIMKLTTKKFRPVLSFKLGAIGKYYDNITPLASGGQPFQIYYLVKRDIPAGVASAIPLIKYFAQMFVWLVVTIFIFIFNHSALSLIGSREVAVTISVAAYVGLVLNSIIPGFLVIVTVLPKFGIRLAALIIKLGVKLKLVKNYDEQLKKAFKLVAEFKSAIKYVSSRWLNVLGLIFVCLVEYVCMLSIPYCLAVSMGGKSPSFELWLNIITLYAYANYAVSFFPTPGATGFTESSFLLVFSGLGLAEGVLFWVVLFWRGFTYYAFIIIGFLIIAYDFIKARFHERFIELRRLLNIQEQLVQQLDAEDCAERLATIRVLKSLEKKSKRFIPKSRPGDIKLNLKSAFSNNSQFPSLLAYRCYQAGCLLIGLRDQDTVGGCQEFYEACRILGIMPVLGFEVQVKPCDGLKRTNKINNIYQANSMTMCVEGFSPSMLEFINQKLAQVRMRSTMRNRRMVERVNELVSSYDSAVDLEKDVIPLSQYQNGGSVSPRHIVEAVCQKLLKRYGRGAELLSVLTDGLGVGFSQSAERHLLNLTNPQYLNDLVDCAMPLVRSFYVDIVDESFSIAELSAIAKECGGALIYPYLGDIEFNVAAETRVEKFEDSYLEDLLVKLNEHGVNGVSYLPLSNSPYQIKRIQELCQEYGLIELCGGSLLNRKQSVESQELCTLEFAKLIDCAWALAGNSLSGDKNEAMFSQNLTDKLPVLADRIALFAARGRNAL